MSSPPIDAWVDAATHRVMPDRAGGDRIVVGSRVQHRDFSFQRGTVKGIFILDGLAWARVLWDGFDRPHLVDPEVLVLGPIRFVTAIPFAGLTSTAELPKQFVNIDFTRAETFVHPDAQQLPKESAEARGGGAKGESTDDRSEGEAAEGAPVVKTATDQATGQVQAGAVDPDSASAPKPSTISRTGDVPVGRAIADSVPIDDGSGQHEVKLAVGSSLPIEREARALIGDIDAWVATGLPVTRTHLASASDRLKMAMMGHTTRWTALAERDTTNYAALYNAVVRDLSAIAEAVGNANGGADITLGIVRELVAQRARWARMFDEPAPISELAGAWLSLTELKPGITREHAAQELDALLNRVRREEREACIEIADRYCGMPHGASCPTEIRAGREAADKTSKGGTNMRAAGESPERGAEEHARPEEPNTMQRDGLPGSDSASAGDAVRTATWKKGSRVRINLEQSPNHGREGEILDVSPALYANGASDVKVQLDGEAGGNWWMSDCLVALAPRPTPSPDDIRALATHLANRDEAIEHRGFTLVPGLRAAAELLDGLQGPMVHCDDGWAKPYPSFTHLATLIPRAKATR